MEMGPIAAYFTGATVVMNEKEPPDRDAQGIRLRTGERNKIHGLEKRVNRIAADGLRLALAERRRNANCKWVVS